MKAWIALHWKFYIIIDAQNEYATGALKTVNVTETRKSIAKLLERYIER
jgi:hypothetical protein